MISLNEYKNKKIKQCEENIDRLDRIHSEFLQEELKENNGAAKNKTRIQALSQELREMSSDKDTDPYNPENFF